MSRTRWIAGALVALVVAVVGGTWVYINLIKDEAPERVTFETRDAESSTTSTTDDTSSTTAGDGTVEGTWTLTDGTQVGYRIDEVLFGQSAEAVGTTDEVTGELVIEGAAATSASFEVDMTTVTSDEEKRDNNFNGRLMEVDTYPTATFELTEPLDFGAVPADGEIVELRATGELTLKDVTEEVEIPIRARVNGGNLEIEGVLEIVFEDWNIENPSNVAASVGESGDLELFLVFTQASS